MTGGGGGGATIASDRAKLSSSSTNMTTTVMMENNNQYHGSPVVLDGTPVVLPDNAEDEAPYHSTDPPTGASSSISPATQTSMGEDDDLEPTHKRPREEGNIMTDEDRLEERRAKNRLSAHQSRLRKRSQLKYLQNQIVALSDDNKKLQGTNSSLVTQLAACRAENQTLRTSQQDAMRLAQALRIAQTGQIPMQGVGLARGFPGFPPY